MYVELLKSKQHFSLDREGLNYSHPLLRLLTTENCSEFFLRWRGDIVFELQGESNMCLQFQTSCALHKW